MPENDQTLGVFSADGDKYFLGSYGSGLTFNTNWAPGS